MKDTRGPQACACGTMTTDMIILQGGMGINPRQLCPACLEKVREHARQILLLTGADEYAVSPMLRPKDWKKPT